MIDTYRRPTLLFPPIAPTADAPRATDTGAISINLAECRASQNRWFSIACAGEALQRFLAPRVITTLVAAAVLWAAIAVLT